MGKKARARFADKVERMASKRGYRLGVLIIHDGRRTAAYSSYLSLDDATEGMLCLKNVIDQLEEDE